MLHSICQQVWIEQQWPQDWKSQFSLQSQRKTMQNNVHTATQLYSSKVMLKILKARLHQNMNRELPDVQAMFQKGRGTRDQIANINWLLEKARE